MRTIIGNRLAIDGTGVSGVDSGKALAVSDSSAWTMARKILVYELNPVLQSVTTVESVNIGLLLVSIILLTKVTPKHNMTVITILHTIPQPFQCSVHFRDNSLEIWCLVWKAIHSKDISIRGDRITRLGLIQSYWETIQWKHKYFESTFYSNIAIQSLTLYSLFGITFGNRFG